MTTLTRNFPIRIETTLRAVAERDWGVVIEHVKHVPEKQRTYFARGKLFQLQRHPKSGVYYTVDKTAKTLIIADGE